LQFSVSSIVISIIQQNLACSILVTVSTKRMYRPYNLSSLPNYVLIFLENTLTPEKLYYLPFINVCGAEKSGGGETRGDIADEEQD